MIASYRLLTSLKIDLAQTGVPSYFVLVIPGTDEESNYKDFYLIHDETDYARFMFGCIARTDEEAVEIALKNAHCYLPSDDDEQLVRQGEWLEIGSGYARTVCCSECKTLGSPQWKRCPICEAKMDVKERK